MKRLLVALLVATLSVLGLTATPAQALTNYIYFYDTPSGTGLLRQASGSGTLACQPMSSYSSNKTQYIDNDTGAYWYVYDGSTCSGSVYGVIYPDSYGPMNSNWSNNISSFKRIS